MTTPPCLVKASKIRLPNGRICAHPRHAPLPLTWTHIWPDKIRYPRIDLRVEVYATLADLRKVVRADHAAGHERSVVRGLLGYCVGVQEYYRDRRGRRRRTPTCAIIRLSRTCLGMETITHEAFHATLRWAERIGITSLPTDDCTSNLTAGIADRHNTSPEETLAGVHGRICRLLVTALRREFPKDL